MSKIAKKAVPAELHPIKDASEYAMTLEVNAAAPIEIEEAVEQSLAMQMISLRLPNRLIEDLKLIARNEGLGYQPLMRRVLTRFASAELKMMARAELGETGSMKKVQTDECPPQTEMPRVAVA